MNEFTLINKFLKPLSLKNKSALNLSDDIYFDYKKKVAISMDTYIHGIHFISTKPNFFFKENYKIFSIRFVLQGYKTSFLFSFCINN